MNIKYQILKMLGPDSSSSPITNNNGFRIGSRVRAIGDVCGLHLTGKLGKVICLDKYMMGGYDLGVEFDEDVNSHDCGGMGRSHHCRWGYFREFELVEE